MYNRSDLDDVMSNDRLNRRSVLKGIGTSAGAIAGGSGAAAAKGGGQAPVATRLSAKRDRQLTSKYSSEESLIELYQDRAMGVLETLSAMDLMEEASTDPLPLGDVREDTLVLDPEDRETGTAVAAREIAGTETAFITTSFSSDGKSVTVYVLPELEDAYSMVAHEDGEVTVHDAMSGEADHMEAQDTPISEKECDVWDDWTGCAPTGCKDFVLVAVHTEWKCCQEYRCTYDDPSNCPKNTNYLSDCDGRCCRAKSFGCTCPGNGCK